MIIQIGGNPWKRTHLGCPPPVAMYSWAFLGVVQPMDRSRWPHDILGSPFWILSWIFRARARVASLEKHLFTSSMKDRYFLDIYHTFTSNYIISQLYYIGSWAMIGFCCDFPPVSTGVRWSKFDRWIVAQDAMALQGNHLTQLLHHCFMNKGIFQNT